MQRPTQTRTHRFVVVYGEEVREIAQAESVWRGWIEKVADPRALDAGEASPPRLGFLTLAEIPDLIRALIKATTPIATADRRPNS